MYNSYPYYLLLFSMCFINSSFAQIKGIVHSTDGNPISSATVSIQNTYLSTSTNKNGVFKINTDLDSCILVFQHLGYKKQKLTWHKNHTTSEQVHITLEPKHIDIEEIEITKNRKPADQIIRNTIANRDKNRKTIDKYEADFYSKGSINLIQIPKKILGQKVDTLKIVKETDGSSILYLSETISKIKVERPNKMYENIIASKVSGNSQGLSFNRADGSDFELYNNYIDFGSIKAISPIADQAFAYYNYQLISSFEEENQIIHKIKVTSKRNAEPTFDGFIYIVDDSWQIYGVEMKTLGIRVNIPVLDTLYIEQQYTYNTTDERWIKQLQILKLSASILGVKAQGNFIQNFSNYNFTPTFNRNTFTRVITKFNEDANNKTDDFWGSHRKISLSNDEVKDYHIKDSIANIKESKAYIDSLDAARSKFKLLNLITSYHFQNTPKKLYIDYESPISIEGISFNTVQVWNIKATVNAKFGNTRDPKLTKASLLFNYQFFDKKLYKIASISHRFNRTKYNELGFSIGNKAEQFNSEDPIGPFINMLSSLIFKDNYMKLYQTHFIALDYSQYLHPNIKLSTHLDYQKRSNLFDRTTYSLSDKENKKYTPNNPLDPNSFDSEAFINHNIIKSDIAIDLYFNTKIERLPNHINYLSSAKYPQLTFQYTNGIASSVKKYTYHEFSTRIKQDISFGNKGLLGYNAKLGTFAKGNEIAFIDYKHFNGNLTHIATTKRYLNTYLLLPYYSHSTNRSYLELHTEYNFQGYLLNKIPGISSLKWNTHVGYHLLANRIQKPYHEFTVGFGNIGWGKYRFFRIDYVHTRNGSYSPNGIVIGISFLDGLITND